MEALYRIIEAKIKHAGYPKPVDGREFFDDVADEADDKENGIYMFMIKKEENLFYEGVMDIMDDQFDLKYVDIHDGDQVYHVDFDAE